MAALFFQHSGDDSTASKSFKCEFAGFRVGVTPLNSNILVAASPNRWNRLTPFIGDASIQIFECCSIRKRRESSRKRFM